MNDKPPIEPNAPATPLPEGAVQGIDGLCTATTALLQHARRQVRLRSPYLDPTVFNTSSFVDALASFVAQHPRNRARFLIEDTTQVLRDNNRLIGVARRLADTIELRVVEDDAKGERDFYLVVDRSAHLIQEDVTRNNGMLARTPSLTAHLIERFDAAWERAESVALRPLGI